MHTPNLRLIARTIGSTKATIFIHGAFSESWGDYEEYPMLKELLNNAGWRDAIYHLWWDSSDKTRFWESHELKSRAKKVGREPLHNLIFYKVAERNVSIMAYSFGARVAYHALSRWSEEHGRHTLQDVILLAGAIDAGKTRSWKYISYKLSGRLINIYNERDFILRVWSVNGFLGNSCGRVPIKGYASKIINKDVASWVRENHELEQYLRCLPNIWRAS